MAQEQAMILLGSTFPLSLVRRRAVITPESVDGLRRRLAAEGCASFWGHENTRAVAAQILGADPGPPTARPALTLDAEKRPVLDGATFSEVWILSPDLVPGYRPQIGEEVAAEHIVDWQVLRIAFEE